MEGSPKLEHGTASDWEATQSSLQNSCDLNNKSPEINDKELTKGRNNSVSDTTITAYFLNFHLS